MRKIFIYVFVLASSVTFLVSCKNDLENLSVCKSKVESYYEKGEYEKDLEAALKPAYDRINQPISETKPVVVFDVDETILSNYNYIKSINYGYKRELWDAYLLTATAGPIGQTVDFYKRLVEKDIAVIFLTARPTESYQVTYDNLVRVGISEFDTLICRSPEYEKYSSAQFKEFERKLLTEEADYNIIMCVGDQDSDMEGAYTGKKIKLPNLLYLTN